MLTLRQRKPNGPWHVRGTVRVGKHVEQVHEHTTGTRDLATAEVYLQKIRAEVSHALLFKFGGDPTKAGRMQHAAVGNGSVVYFFRSGELIKIGVTNDVKRRRELIQNAHGQRVEIIAVIQGDRMLEQVLHRIFRPYRSHGEWYLLPEELRSSIADLGKWGKRKQPWQVLGQAFIDVCGVKNKSSNLGNGLEVS